ncbi:MAG: ABC transporter ATP-binding protein [Candidatus Symbiobacter sp.]|nr:ABC transporter ATP-binding protein [Candidatus Symbiobacter sp.]
MNPSGKNPPILAIKNLVVRYGQLTALRQVSFEVWRGETVFITGPNGAGKSTLLKALAGAVRPASGSIHLFGENITQAMPEAIARLQFSMVPEGRHVFGGLTVRENLLMATAARRGESARAAAIAATLDQVYQLFPPLKQRAHTLAASLSGGQQQMLVIGRALMTDARLIAIDEPSLGLAPKITDEVYQALFTLRDQAGLSLVIVEQSTTRAVMEGGRMILLRSGEVVLSGAARALTETVIEQAYFGTQDTPKTNESGKK